MNKSFTLYCMNKKSNVKVKTTTRIDKRFSVSMALIAALAILAIGSTSTIAMAHRGHHSDNGGSGSGGGSSDSNPNCGFAQILGSDGQCHYSLRGALNACVQHLGECLTVGKLVLGGL